MNELKEAQNRIALALRFRQLEAGKEDRDLALFSDAVAEALRVSLGGAAAGNTGPLAVREALRTRGAWESVRTFLERAGFLGLKPSERMAAFRFLAGLLVEHAREVSQRSGAPVSARLVASCAASMPSLFDRAFPGYLACGLALAVIRRIVSPQPEPTEA